jgi:hypothetical protein
MGRRAASFAVDFMRARLVPLVVRQRIIIAAGAGQTSLRL